MLNNYKKLQSKQTILYKLIAKQITQAFTLCKNFTINNNQNNLN